MLPLTICFFHHCWNSSSEEDLPNDFKTHQTNAFEVVTGLAIDILRLHSGRRRNLHLTASLDIFKRFSGSAEPKQLISLELAATTVRHLLLPMPEFMLESEFNLTHLKLINFPLTSINRDICWDNITHATLFELTTDEGFDFLRRAFSLKYYCVSMDKPPNIGLTSSILHPRLAFASSADTLFERHFEANQPSVSRAMDTEHEWSTPTYGSHAVLSSAIRLLPQSIELIRPSLPL